jgi:hypothetical protein
MLQLVGACQAWLRVFFNRLELCQVSFGAFAFQVDDLMGVLGPQAELSVYVVRPRCPFMGAAGSEGRDCSVWATASR